MRHALPFIVLFSFVGQAFADAGIPLADTDMAPIVVQNDLLVAPVPVSASSRDDAVIRAHEILHAAVSAPLVPNSFWLTPEGKWTAVVVSIIGALATAFATVFPSIWLATHAP